jgi:hypothetical protein
MKIDIRKESAQDAAMIALETRPGGAFPSRSLTARWWAKMLTCEWSDWRNGNVWWIQSVYLAAAFPRRGAYEALYAAIQEEARDNRDPCGIRRYFEKSNERAQVTLSYPRYGRWHIPGRGDHVLMIPRRPKPC